MNRLELCNKLVEKAELQGGDLTATTGQSGEDKRVVNWIDEAYNLIQISKSTWRFLRADKTETLISGTQECADSTVARWIDRDCRIYLTASDETWCFFVPWDVFRRAYLLGSLRTQTGRPTYFSIKPDNKLIFYPTPDDAYSFDTEVYIVPDTMTADISDPLIPERYHMAIVWRALMIYAAEYSSEVDKYDAGNSEFRKIYRKLTFDQLDRAYFGAPLV